LSATARALVEEGVALARQCSTEIRTASYLLHPPLLDEIGLDAALSWYSEGLTKRSGIETSIEMEPSDFPRLTPSLETMVFRIIQEALTNVFRHSAAKKCWVSVAKKENQVRVTVRDDGRGFTDEIAAFHPEKIGVGIGGIRQRIKEVGGVMSLRNAQPQGAILETVIPIAMGAAHGQSASSNPKT
jgi:two-component system NarL family sensor kinase